MVLELLRCEISPCSPLTAFLGETYDIFARLCSVSAPRPHFTCASRCEEGVVAAGPAGGAVVVPSRLAGVWVARGRV